MEKALQSSDLISVQEYLDGEQISEIRHEYIDGQVYAMSGGTRDHNRITGNVFAFLDANLDGSPCSPFINDVKLQVLTIESSAFYYPDVVVTCDPEDNNPMYIENPTTIFEVLSDSTERIDRQEKFFAYRTLPNLEEYVLISQKKKEVTIARKKNNWEAEIYTGDEFEISLSCSAKKIPSEKIYRNIDFSTRDRT